MRPKPEGRINKNQKSQNFDCKLNHKAENRYPIDYKAVVISFNLLNISKFILCGYFIFDSLNTKE